MWPKGNKKSPEAIERMSRTLKGRKSPCGMRGKNHNEETKKKISLAHIGMNASEETKKKMSLIHKGRELSEETKRKIGLSLKGKNCSEETKKKISFANKGRKYNEEIRKKMSMRQKGHQVSEKTKRRASEVHKGKKTSERMKRLWSKSDYIRKQMKSRGVKPNNQEIRLADFLNKLFLNEYKYVGDGEFIIAGKCPDFVNINGKKKIIELYGEYWHRNDNPQDRIDLFKQYGYDTMIVWERELKNLFRLKWKLRSFNMGKERNENN